MWHERMASLSGALTLKDRLTSQRRRLDFGLELEFFFLHPCFRFSIRPLAGPASGAAGRLPEVWGDEAPELGASAWERHWPSQGAEEDALGGPARGRVVFVCLFVYFWDGVGG